MPRWYFIIGIGLIAGLFSGLLGVGGGVILVPAMVYLIRLSQHEAHGTSLAVILFAASFGVISYILAGDVEWPVVAELAVGGIIGAPAGAWAANRLRSATLRRIFGIFLLLIALRMLYDAFFGGTIAGEDMFISASGLWRVPAVAGIGLVTGFLSGLLGVGGGVVMVPAMVLLLGMSQHVAQGNSLAVIVPISISGIIAHHRSENVRIDVLKWLAIGAVVGGPVGGQIAVYLSDHILKGIFSILLIVLGLRMSVR